MKKDISKSIYEEQIIKVEKYSETFNWSFTRVTTPISFFPSLILCYLTYFTTDAGSDAFKLPFVQWYDLKKIMKTHCVNFL